MVGNLDSPGGDLEEGLVANRTVMLLLLEMHFANVTVEPIGFRDILRPLLKVVGKFQQTGIHFNPIFSLILNSNCHPHPPVRLREGLLALVARVHLHHLLQPTAPAIRALL